MYIYDFVYIYMTIYMPKYSKPQGGDYCGCVKMRRKGGGMDREM